MSEFEEHLQGLKDAGEVRCHLDKLCEPWGGIKKLDVVTDRHGDLLCFVELMVPENKTRFYSVIKGTSYGNSFVFTIRAKNGAGEGGKSND